MRQRFDETIVTCEVLRELYGQPGSQLANKTIDHIDHVCRRFIAACPFVLIATRGADGRIDVSPKGDTPGFVLVLDDNTLALPDRRGNKRLDTFENLLVYPEVGLFFLVPGNGGSLRVSGTGQIVRDAALQASASVNGIQPSAFLVINVEEAFLYCAKPVTRSKIWQPEHWPDRVALLARADIPQVAP